jgi:hypothetical protein
MMSDDGEVKKTQESAPSKRLLPAAVEGCWPDMGEGHCSIGNGENHAQSVPTD